jgi:hypothetical protein
MFEEVVINIFPIFFLWWDWFLNSGLQVCKAGIVPLEQLQSQTILKLIRNSHVVKPNSFVFILPTQLITLFILKPILHLSARIPLLHGIPLTLLVIPFQSPFS